MLWVQGTPMPPPVAPGRAGGGHTHTGVPQPPPSPWGGDVLLQHISQTYRGTGLSGFTGGTLETLRTLWFWGEKGKKKGGKMG